MIKKNQFLGSGRVSPTKAAEVMKSWEEQARPVCNTVYEVWRFTKPKTKEGLWFPQDLTVKHKGILKSWATWIDDFGFEPVKVLKYLIEEWEFMRQEMFFLMEQPVVEQLMKRRSELLNYYTANAPKKPVSPAKVVEVVEVVKSPVVPEKIEEVKMVKPSEVNCSTVIRKPKLIIRRKPAQPEPDANCFTLPNGDCVSEKPCMHTPKALKGFVEGQVPVVPQNPTMEELEQWYAIQGDLIKGQFAVVEALRGDESLENIVLSKNYGTVVWQYQRKVDHFYKLMRKMMKSSGTINAPKSSVVETPLLDEGSAGIDVTQIPDYEE